MARSDLNVRVDARMLVEFRQLSGETLAGLAEVLSGVYAIG